MGVVRYEWRGHAVWLSHELLIEMEVATSYCFVGGSSIQTGAVDASEVSFFLMLKMSTTESVGPMNGINKDVTGAKLLPTTILTCPVV